ncbi:hypothetical protein C7M61_004840 [Candidozyma pseudohaemuli]|uniref:FK506-binding protein n=1 Tax=Candidozyma pseudohaemuli TaxID=418784 RepID=A0A2P7YGT6_9ASCO|nr:hypothetical protein C7M61_004840 [[Candida] pseudohaemulonii]PSK35176.1 hypothetical protein C7M61_004840 [[Candida] pseudohaemulonii]
MASLLPISTYNLALEPFNPQPALQEEFPVTVRITMAAVDPEAADDKEEPSTLRVLKRAIPFGGDDAFDLDSEDEDDEEDELDSEEEPEEPKKESKKEKKSKKLKKEEEEEEEEEEEDEDDEDDEDDLDDEVEEFVLCTLSPKVQFQQTIDFTVSPNEEVHFVVTGSYPIHLSGNYVEHPADDEEDDFDSEDEDEYDSDAYNLTPDEDELLDIEALEDASDIEGKIEELVEEEGSKKRAAEEEPQASKKSKKEKKKEDKKVQFTKELEQGPTPLKKEKKEKAKEEKKKEDKEEKKDKKFPTKTLLGGVITEDRKTGSGATAKSGNKVGIRYIGKLKDGKVFDKNTSGKPFVFNLGKGECIKGFDLGVAGMAVGGERRVVIPPKMAYGSQKLPGIPANSELTFDIKLVSLK